MQVYAIETGRFKLDGGAMFGVVPKSLWSKVHPADENNLCTWTMRCLLIQEAGKLILVDNGIGDKQDERFFRHYYLHGDDSLDRSLAKHGFHRDDITDVLLTHLHFDHCGGSIVRSGDKLIPAFKNATYWSHSRHWKWATEPNEREKASFLKENILPIQDSGQLKFVDQASGSAASGQVPAGAPNTALPAGATWPGGSLDILSNVILPGLSVRVANGHTEAMILPQMEYKSRTLVFMADLLPSVGHISLPWIMAYDMFPLTTLKEKKSFWEEAATGGYALMLEHDPDIECCVLESTDRGVRTSATFRLEEL
jgi:glyoxylase-like metal-dependent hydrolase (beta-lactamase superfamily II)